MLPGSFGPPSGVAGKLPVSCFGARSLPSRSGIPGPTASSFYRRAQPSFVFRRASFRSPVIPRDAGNWLHLFVHHIFSFRSLFFFNFAGWFAPPRLVIPIADFYPGIHARARCPVYADQVRSSRCFADRRR